MAREKTKKINFANFATKEEARNAALASVEKQHGKEAARLYGDSPLEKIPVISTGSLNLDIALGVGGYPMGRIIEIYGPEASGKTTLALHAIAQVQKMGGNAAFIDAEHALDPKWATTCGVNMDELVFSQPDSGEQALGIVETFAGSGGFQLIVVDSVAALVPQAEIDGDMGDFFVGTQARLMSQACRKLAGITHKSGTTIIFLNQMRKKIGVMFGSNETTTGGDALKFYASVRLDIRRRDKIKESTEEDAPIIGFTTHVKVIKNKVAPPLREAAFDIIFSKGINRLAELVDNAVVLKLVEKSGSWYSYNGERLGQGMDNTAANLVKHPDIAEAIEHSVLKHYNLEEK